MVAGIRYSFILFFSILLCFSCSIQKRHHTGGYYIQWHKRYRSGEGEKKKEKEEDTTAVVLVEDEEDTLTKKTLIAEEIKTDTATVQPKQKKYEALEDLPRGERKFEPLGVLAAKILAVDILVGFLNDNSNTHKQAVQYGILFLVILGTSFILGLISMIRYLRHPKHYKFNIFALIGMIIPLIFLIAFLTNTIDFF